MYVSSSLVYMQDEITWCVRSAQFEWRLFSLLLVADIEEWVLCIFGACLFGFVVFLSTFLGSCKKMYRGKDITYFLTHVALPTATGTNLNYKPDGALMRLAFFLVVFGYMTCMNIWFTYVYKFLTEPQVGYQTKSMQDLVRDKFVIAGTNELMTRIFYEGNVSRRSVWPSLIA